MRLQWAPRLLLLLLARPLSAQSPALLPQPTTVTFTDAGFALPETVTVSLSPDTPRMREIAGILGGALADLGIVMRRITARDSSPAIRLRISNPRPDDESYRLTATPRGVNIEAHAGAGALWGVQTLRQLLVRKGDRWVVAGATITDAPRYRWRGTMLDVGRHLFTVEYILKHLDWMSRYKLNVFHWHLTEDQGWRIAIEAYPRLTEVGAWRTERNGSRYGGFYTRDDIRRVVERARVLGITVVPEIEMPGHSRAALAAYPSLGCTGDSLAVPATWGVFADVLCPGKEATFEFLQRVLSEVLALFPSKYIHIGGDEVPKLRWQQCAECQAIIRREQLGDEHGLQRWMIARIGRWLRQHGRSLIGWDEILDGGLPEGATIQAWQGSGRITEAMKAGADVIASPSDWVYLSRPADGLPLAHVAAFDPQRFAVAGSGRLLGAEAPLWTEHVTSAANAELLWWPRLLAFAEAVWHGPADPIELQRRITPISEAMRSAGVAVGPTDQALFAIRFAYDSMAGRIRVTTDQAPGLQFMLQSRESGVRALASGDTLPATGDWSIGARWHDQSVGEPRPIRLVNDLAVGRPLTFATPTDKRYPGTGPHTLVDGVLGTAYNDGFWNGWQGPDLDVTVDLGADRAIGAVELSLLEEVNNWILYPAAVEAHLSDDGTSWRSGGRQELHLPVVADAASRKIVRLELPGASHARYVRVVATTGGPLPAWHSGAGQPAWIFADEVMIRSPK